MSKLIEQVAKEICLKYDTTIFSSGDLDILHEIYDECVKRGMKPVKFNHPSNVLQRIRNGLRLNMYFDRFVCGESILRRVTFYQLKENFNED